MTDEAIHLSERQVQVLTLVAEGATDREVARQFKISAKMASNYMASSRARLDAYSRAHAVALALQQGLLPDNETAGERSRACPASVRWSPRHGSRPARRAGRSPSTARTGS